MTDTIIFGMAAKPDTARMRELATWIETNDCQVFSMSNWLRQLDKNDKHDMEDARYLAELADQPFPENFCGTAGCIAGACVSMVDGVHKTYQYVSQLDIPNRATQLLGLTHDQALALFTPDRRRDRSGQYHAFGHITRAAAVAVLRSYADDLDEDPGVRVDWTAHHDLMAW